MTTTAKSTITCSLIFLLLSGCTGGLRLPGYDYILDDTQRALFDRANVVPDEIYIEQRCNAHRDVIRRIRENPQLTEAVDLEMVEAVVAKLNKSCDDLRAGKVGVNDWVRVFGERTLLLGQLTTGCGRIVQCLSLHVPPDKPLPSDFRTYSILLFPSVEWAKFATEKQLLAVSEAFADFGTSIGERRAAIFLSQRASPFTPDIERSKFFCDRLGLDYNAGPYIITSRKRPDYLTKADDFVVIRLEGIAPNRIVKVLNILEMDLRSAHGISKRTLEYEEIRQRAMTVVERNADLALEIAKGAISSNTARAQTP